jgi:hypothetical protein
MMANTLVQQPPRSLAAVILPVKAEQKPLYQEFVMAMVISSPRLTRINRVTTLSMVLAPLHALLGLFMPLQSASAMLRHPTKQGAAQQTCRTPAFDAAPWRLTATNNAPAVLATATKPASCNRLKIVRAFEPGVSSSCAGRMVISGRMADVCAELDRMAQRETPQRTL